MRQSQQYGKTTLPPEYYWIERGEPEGEVRLSHHGGYELRTSLETRYGTAQRTVYSTKPLEWSVRTISRYNPSTEITRSKMTSTTIRTRGPRKERQGVVLGSGTDPRPIVADSGRRRPLLAGPRSPTHALWLSEGRNHRSSYPALVWAQSATARLPAVRSRPTASDAESLSKYLE